MTPRRMISPGFVFDALDSLRVRGLDPGPVLGAAGLPPSISDPVSNLQYGALWLAISSCLEDEFFGLAARPMRPGSFKLLCHCVLHARTLEQALRRALLFLSNVLDDPTGELAQREGQAEILLRDRGAPRSAFAYVRSTEMLFAIVFVVGASTLGTQLVAYAFAGQYHPTQIRSTGVGFATGIGRLGAILDPSLIGFLVSLQLPLEQNFMAIGVAGFIGTIAVLLIDQSRAASNQERTVLRSMQGGSIIPLRDSGGAAG